MFNKFDGTGREPRHTQRVALKWLESKWATPLSVIEAPTGTGKSGLSRAVQIATNALVCTPSNMLMDQYTADYPMVNALKGATHYPCSDNAGFTCEDVAQWKDSTKCANCPYQLAKNAAFVHEPTFVNPYSLFYLQLMRGYKPPQVMIFDEAHTLMSTLMSLSSASFNTRKFKSPKSCQTDDVLKWLKKLEKDINSSTFESDEVDLTKAKLRDKIYRTIRNLTDHPELYVIFEQGNSLMIQALTVPDSMLRKYFSAAKIILMSATISRFDVKELFGTQSFDYLALPNPIPLSHRPVYYSPAPFAMNKDTSPALIAAYIKTAMKKYPNRNTIVHLTYSDSTKVAEFFPGAITNTPATKQEAIAKFKAEGGLFLASGCAEGLDLPGKLCELNIIPKLLKPNLGDPFVIKRRSLADGNAWYNHQVIKTLIQQLGRSTRGADDKSIGVVGDRSLFMFLGPIQYDVSQDFYKSIIRT